MPQAHNTALFAMKDCAIKRMLTDPAGGIATYGPLLPIDAPKTLLYTPSFKTDTIRGGMQVRSSRSVRTEAKWTLTAAGFSLDVEAAMMGGAIADTGVDPNQVTSYNEFGDDQLPLFMIEGRCTAVDGPAGDFHLVLYRCQIDSDPFGFADEAHHVISIGGTAMQRISDKKLRTLVLNQQAAAIA